MEHRVSKSQPSRSNPLEDSPTFHSDPQLRQKVPGGLGFPPSTITSITSARRSGRVCSQYRSSRGIHSFVQLSRAPSPSRVRPLDSLRDRGALTHTPTACLPSRKGDVAKTPSTISTDGSPTRHTRRDTPRPSSRRAGRMLIDPRGRGLPSTATSRRHPRAATILGARSAYR